jgi:hypothetical protein
MNVDDIYGTKPREPYFTKELNKKPKEEIDGAHKKEK